MHNSSPPCERGEGRKAAGGVRAAEDSGPYKGIPVGADVPIRPFDGRRTHDPHPHPPPAGAPSLSLLSLRDISP